MDIRMYQSSDYPMLCKWWKAHSWTPPGEDHLPSIGFVIDDKCAGFLFQTDSKFALIELLISNPETDKQERSDALDLLIDTIKSTARDLNFKTLYSNVSQKSLVARYQKHGIVATDTNMTSVVGKL